MKKAVIILLLLSLVFSLFSCGKNENETTADSSESAETESITETEESLDFTPIESSPATETEEQTETDPASVTEPEEQPPQTEAPAPADPAPVTPPVVNQGSYSGDPLISRMTFLGDSTTYGLKYYGVVGDNQVWTPKNGTLALFRATTDYIVDPASGAEYTISDMCSMYKPDILVITLGVNGISMLDESAFKMYYDSLIEVIQTASPSTKIALQTMYPLSASYDTSSGINNTKISNGNRWIADIASSHGIACINSASVLVDSTGYRPEAWQNGDGLHMSAEGFAVVMNYMINNPCY